jgi:hypothetical protein
MLSQNHASPGCATPCALWCGGTQDQVVIISFLRRKSYRLLGRNYGGDTDHQGQIIDNARQHDWRLGARRHELAARLRNSKDLAAAQTLVPQAKQ